MKILIRYFHVVVLLTLLISPIFSLRTPSFRLRRESYVVRCQRDELIDPLDSVEQTNASKSIREEQQKEDTKKVKNENEKETNVKRKEGMEVFDDNQYIDTTSFEVKRLQTLPAEYLKATKYLIQQLLPRVALGVLVLHVMLLLPTLYYLKVVLKFQTVIPFLYLAPIVFLVPYIVCFLWEYEIVRVPYIDNRVRQLIDTQTKKAKDLLIQKEEDLTIRINLQREAYESGDMYPEIDNKDESNENELHTLQMELALLRLLSKIDADALATEILNLKRFLFKQSGEIDSGSSSSGGGVSGIENVDSFLEQLSQREKQSKEDRISIATNTFVEMAVLDVGGDKEETLNALKKFQTDLNNMVVESEPLQLLNETRKDSMDRDDNT